MSEHSKLPEQPTPTGARMGRAEVRRRATQGAAVLGVRMGVIKVLSLGANIVLARLLTPRDFGLVAFGASLVTVAALLSDGGIGLGLIIGPNEPDPLDLGTLLGFQLIGSTVVVLAVALCALPFGEGGRITTIIAFSLPLGVWGSPGAIILERQLAYRTIAWVEILGVLTYLSWATVSVALGAGVWGLASAMALGPAVQSLATLIAVPKGRVRPRLMWDRMRRFLGFGTRFQAAGLTDLAYQQGINLGTVSFVGVSTLGIWTFVIKLMQVPFDLLTIFVRVSFPTMARLMDAGEDPAARLEEFMRVIAVSWGLLIAEVVGTAPASIPVVFGSSWHSAIDVLPWVGAAYTLSGPIGIALVGYLYARGEAGLVLRTKIIDSLVGLGVGLPLLPLLGVEALGIGMVAQVLVQMALYRAAVRPWVRVRVLVGILPQVASTCVAAGSGWLCARLLGPVPPSVAISALVTGAVYLGSAAIFGRPALLESGRLVWAGLRPGGTAAISAGSDP